MLKLSPSKLNLYRDCPRCFWLSVVKGIQQPSGPMATILTGLDGRIKSYFSRYRATGKLPPLIDGKIDGKLVERPISFLKFVEDELGLTFTGKLDECIILSNGRYAPVDHKSRGSIADSVHPAYQVQMDAYALLLQKNNYPTADKGYLIYYVPTDGELHQGFPFKVDVKEVPLDGSRTTKLIAEATEVARRHKEPDPSNNCAFCKWEKALRGS